MAVEMRQYVMCKHPSVSVVFNGNIKTSINLCFRVALQYFLRFNLWMIRGCAMTITKRYKNTFVVHLKMANMIWESLCLSGHQWPLLLTWFNFNPSMDK